MADNRRMDGLDVLLVWVQGEGEDAVPILCLAATAKGWPRVERSLWIGGAFPHCRGNCCLPQQPAKMSGTGHVFSKYDLN